MKRPKMAKLRRMAYQESLALREFAKQGRSPKCGPVRFPWHDGYLSLDHGLDRDELLPDADERPWFRKDLT